MPPVKIKEKGKPLSYRGKAYPALVVEKTIIPIVVRRDIETREPCLFFMNGDTRGRSWLTGYAHVGQHFEPDWHYYHHRTKSASLEEADVAALVREWANQPPRDEYTVMSGFPPWGRKIA